MTTIYILNHLGNTKPYDHNSFDTLLSINNGDFGKFRTVKSVENNHIISNLKYYSFNFKLEEGETLEDGLIRRGSFNRKDQFTVKKIEDIKPGQFYPRIFRPFLVENNIMLFENGDHVSETAKIEEFLKKDYIQLPNYFPVDQRQLTLGINQLSFLKELLITILNTVHPSADNLNVYGNNMKNLLLLACVEVETQLKGIYKANEKVAKDKYSTNDYIKLKAILHLDKYEVRFPFYPDLKPIKPFLNWSTIPSPTKSIEWYDSYNAIKHNSSEDFHRANLINIVNAVAAVAVLLHAQYGKHIPFWRDMIGNYINVSFNYEWDITEKILPPIEGEECFYKPIGL